MQVPESSTRTSKCYGPTDSTHKYNKTEIPNWLPTILTTTLCPNANGESLMILYTHP